jgi:kynureninase
MTGSEVPPEVAELDRLDPLAPLRNRFLLPDGVTYLDGNSLGALPIAVRDRVARVVEEEWGQSLIRAWNQHDWITLAARVGARIAPLVGAASHEVIAADSTSVNLYKLIAAALRLRPDRRTVVTETGNFPTDSYVIEGVVEGVPGGRLHAVAAADLEAAIDGSTALVVLTHVHYKTGAVHDMARLTRAAHGAGALILWDLSHTAGAMPVALDEAGADLAVGCGYKYLNGGPGAPAWLFVAERHQTALRSPLTGWLGHAAPFEFEETYRPAPGIGRFLCGTPGILGLSALDAALDLFDATDMGVARQKAMALGDLFIRTVEAAGDRGLVLASPRDSGRRGNQVSFRHAHGYAIMQALIAQGIIGDFRAPDILRFGFAPLYVRYRDVWQAARSLCWIIDSESWRDPAFARRAAVT